MSESYIQPGDVVFLDDDPCAIVLFIEEVINAPAEHGQNYVVSAFSVDLEIWNRGCDYMRCDTAVQVEVRGSDSVRVWPETHIIENAVSEHSVTPDAIVAIIRKQHTKEQQ